MKQNKNYADAKSDFLFKNIVAILLLPGAFIISHYGEEEKELTKRLKDFFQNRVTIRI
jgi:hypothetical protein